MIENPAWREFMARLGAELVLALVVIRRVGTGFEVRQVEDRGAAAESLRTMQLPDARALAQRTADGAFRPLKCAPNLQRGWRLAVANEPELEAALQQVYPGAVADMFAAKQTPPPVTNFREFVNRQSGMYRVTANLSDAGAAEVIREGCDKSVCLKRRMWTVAGLAPDEVEAKSVIPCLEPCAVLLELARKRARGGGERIAD